MRQLNKSFWRGKRVFLTGHTGFKGSWLGFWLSSMGAQVTGYSLAPKTQPAMFDLLKLEGLLDHQIGDIRNRLQLADALAACNPDVVFHLAAQPIVSEGYTSPVETFDTNIMGVVNLLEACRALQRQVPVLIVSSDKCYLNNGSGRAFEVEDPLGGYDPYSASKAGTEIVTASYRASFFNSPDSPLIASARAGNVVGGGDWSPDRLLPDCARAFHAGDPVTLRNPSATRPWQHVLEPLYGYLVLIEAMAADPSFARPWNFGPIDRNHQPVGEITKLFCDAWGDGAKVEMSQQDQSWKESATLDLNCAATTQLLEWSPVMDIKNTISLTVDWYKRAYGAPDAASLRSLTTEQIELYETLQSS